MAFQHELAQQLSKFTETDTLLSGVEGLRNLMKIEVTDNERMTLLIHKLTDFNEHIKPN